MAARSLLLHSRRFRLSLDARQRIVKFSSTALCYENKHSLEAARPIQYDYATIKESYRIPKYPIVLAHGLFGFDELHLASKYLPGVQYWRGVTDAFTSHGIEVIKASVPASASIQERAAKLAQDIGQKAMGKKVNIIAHSMGGLDARYMVSNLKPANVEVLSLTTVATPHRGSALADHIFRQIGATRLPTVYKVLKGLSLETGAFSQLTRQYMNDKFNPNTPNIDGIRYFSYGATATPHFWSAFKQSHRIVEEAEGSNDGLVSVSSSQWGEYRGTLVDVSHLDLINWTNRFRLLAWEMAGNRRTFNAIAFYLGIAEMLSDEGF